jgi:hypothetical protein
MNSKRETFERLDFAGPRSDSAKDTGEETARSVLRADWGAAKSANLAIAALASLLFLSLLPGTVRAGQAETPGRQSAHGKLMDSPGIVGAGSGNLEQAQSGVQQPPAPVQPRGEAKAGEQQKKDQNEKAKKKAKNGSSNHRTFFLMPDYLTVENGSQAPPLTPAQKFKLMAQGTFDPFQFPYYGFLAGIGQATNSESGYGQGAGGYGKRYAAIFGDTTIKNFLVVAALPSLFRQDPRYYRKGKGGFASRTLYALNRVFVTRSDSGRQQFNAPEIFGSVIAASISTYSYHPDADRKFGSVAATWGAQLGGDVYGFMIKEFWPDIRRHLRKKRREPAGRAKSGSE